MWAEARVSGRSLPVSRRGRCRLIYVRRLGERANFGFGQWTLFRARTGMPAFPPVLPEADRVGVIFHGIGTPLRG